MKTLTFRGRANRLEYFSHQIVGIVAYVMALTFVDSVQSIIRCLPL